MICQNCGVEAPTKHVAFYQNIGALLMRFSKTAEGNMCKSCVHRTFWSFTLTNLTLGWWGVISLLVTPFFVVNNVVRYVGCLGMDPVPPGAVPAELTPDVVERLRPLTDELLERFNRGDEFERVVEDIAMKAHATNGQVALYVHVLVAAAAAEEDDEDE